MQTTVLLLAENPYFGGITAHIRSILLALRNHPRLSFKVATFPGWSDDKSLIGSIRETDHGVEVLPMRWRGDWRVPESLGRGAVALQD